MSCNNAGNVDILVVGVWGFPGSWLLARYYAPVPPREYGKWGKLAEWGFSDEPIETHSSLVALAKTLCDAGWHVRAVVYALDTLAAPQFLDLRRIPVDDEVRRRLAENTNRLIDEFFEKDPCGYKEVAERASRVLNLYVEGYFGEAGLGADVVDAVIVPGVGTFSLKTNKGAKRYVFRGSPFNTLLSLEYDLFKRLIRYKPKAVILDISHGINFMPVVAIYALHWAVRVYSALESVEVGVAIVNSDPVTSHRQEAILHVVKVNVISKKPLEFLARLSEEVLEASEKGKLSVYRMLKKAKPPDELINLDRKFKNIIEDKDYLSVIKVLRDIRDYGLILYLIHILTYLKASDIRKDYEEIHKLLDNILNSRKLEIKNNTVVVSHDFLLNAPIILNTIYILHLLEKTAKDVEDSIKEGLIKNVHGYQMIELNMLKDYAKKIGLSKPAQTILDNELHDIERRVKLYRAIVEQALEKPKPYSLVYEALETKALELLDEDRRKQLLRDLTEKAEKMKCKIDKRNFYAHAGLERNTIAVMATPEKSKMRISIGYHPKCLEEIKKIFG